jgi:hypothetical protein
MLRDVIEVRPLERYELLVRFDDGAQGVVDVSQLVRLEGVFEPLRRRSFFTQVHVHPELGVICWPNGADLDSAVLYSQVTGAPLPGGSALQKT